MSNQPIDYDALAKQYGAVTSQSGQVDYDALAKQYGATSSAQSSKRSLFHWPDPSFNPISEPAGKYETSQPPGSAAATFKGMGKGALDVGRSALNSLTEGIPGVGPFAAPLLDKYLPAVPASKPGEEEAGRATVNYGTTAAGAALAAPEALEMAGPALSKLMRTGAELGKGAGRVADVATFERLSKGIKAARQTGENIGNIWRSEPVFPREPLGPPSPDPAYVQSSGLRAGARPAASPSDALARIPLAEQMKQPEGEILPPEPASSFWRTTVGRQPYPPGRNIGLQGGDVLPGGGVVVRKPIGALPPAPEEESPRLIDQMQRSIQEPAAQGEPSLNVKVTKDYPRLVEQMKASPELSRPVTENPVVGSFARAMQNSGMPIADRPSLLLKGSGRVNRILGPEEDLTDALAKSERLARRQRGQ